MRKKRKIDFKALCIYIKKICYYSDTKKQRMRNKNYFNFTFEKYAARDQRNVYEIENIADEM